MTHIVDRAAWPRRELFDFFSPMSQPFFSVTFRQDVTRLYQFTKENRLSFYHSLVYLCARAVNGVEAFRYALRGAPVRFPLIRSVQMAQSVSSPGAICQHFLNR